MIRLVKRLFIEPDEDPALIDQMLKLTQQFGRIHLEVQNGLRSGPVEEQIVVIDKALKELPSLEREVRSLFAPIAEWRRRYLGYFSEVIATYILFCERCKTSLIENESNEAKFAMSYRKEAIRLLKEAQRNFKL